MPPKKTLKPLIAEAAPGQVYAADPRRPGVPTVVWDRTKQVVEVELPVESAGRDPIWVSGTFAANGGQLVLVELRFYHPRWSQSPTDENPEGWPALGSVEIPSPGLTARLLRGFRLGELLEVLQDRPPGEESWWSTRGPDAQTFKALVADSARRPGRAGREDRFYALWAARYVAAGARAPIARLAEEHGLKRERVRDLIHEARRRRLLTDGPKGSAGGKLTDEALRLLDDWEGEQPTAPQTENRKPTKKGR